MVILLANFSLVAKLKSPPILFLRVHSGSTVNEKSQVREKFHGFSRILMNRKFS